MSQFQVHLLGKFEAVADDQVTACFGSRKVQELFCYLCIHRQRAHLREALASMLWTEKSGTQSRKYLRQAVWQLQHVLGALVESVEGQVLLIEPEEIRINPKVNLWLDVSELEEAFTLTRKIPGKELSDEQAHRVMTAVQLYRGDLLEGWYQDWCLYERERLENIYLTMLHNLIEYCETHREYESGIDYTRRILAHDRASERSYQALMRLEYLAGDRTAALRAYERCIVVLHEELDVEPSTSTVALFVQIQTDRLSDPPMPAPSRSIVHSDLALEPQLLARFKKMQEILDGLQRQVQEDIQMLERYFQQAT
jgi:DNA-binding SARP family transcriptional activator